MLKESQAETPSIARYRDILAEAALLHERYVSSRPEPFNIFSVLRSASDEVNLHSRFLAALLDHRQPNDKERSNLQSFLESVAGVDQFDQSGVRVGREKYNVDILITNDSKHAVVVENKIWAGDQPGQLQRYHSELMARDFPDKQIHLCYLTPYGRDPSDKSVGTLDPTRVKKIAYQDPKFQDWLRSCQKRAYDEPELRESVGQYLRVVQKLTGTDVNEEHRDRLIKLCLENNNLAVVHDLKNVFDEAWIQLMWTTFTEIEEELTNRVDDLPEKHQDCDISRDRISSFVYPRGEQWCGLSFRLTNTSQLGVGVDRGDQYGIYWGIKCIQDEHGEAYEHIRETLKGGDPGPSKEWPWWKYADEDFKVNPQRPSREALTIWANHDRRNRFVTEIVEGVAELWKRIKDADLYRSP